MVEHRAGLLALVIALLLAPTSIPTQDQIGAALELPPFPKAAATITLKGSCVFAGEPPPVKRISFTGCATSSAAYQGKEAPILPALQMDASTRGLPHCLVRVEGLEKRWGFAQQSVPRELEYKDHLLMPYVIGVVVGEEVRVTSRDACCYNLHWMGKLNRLRWTNITLKRDDQVGFDTFTRPEIAWFKDDIHGWIKAWVHVLPHPVFAVTDETGRFVLPKLPPGEYDVSVWHEKWKAMPQRVVLGAEHAERGKVMRFELAASEAPRR